MRPSYPALFEKIARDSTLALLVARILADDPHDALAPDNLAVPADALD